MLTWETQKFYLSQKGKKKKLHVISWLLFFYAQHACETWKERRTFLFRFSIVFPLLTIFWCFFFSIWSVKEFPSFAHKTLSTPSVIHYISFINFFCFFLFAKSLWSFTLLCMWEILPFHPIKENLLNTFTYNVSNQFQFRSDYATNICFMTSVRDFSLFCDWVKGELFLDDFKNVRSELTFW